MSKQNDRALRIYNEVFGLDRLHYGMWQPDDELTIEKLKMAQERYETYLMDNIPEGVKRVLDVGCGTGVMSRALAARNYDVEGLSPDDNQKELFTASLDRPFHHTIFEDFVASTPFDCLIMSESAQYINLQRLFKTAAKTLGGNGFLMVCDYFVLTGANGILAKSGHNYDAFMQQAKADGFVMIKEEDITDAVTKTLDIGKLFVDKSLLAFDIGTEKIRARHPYLTRLAGRLIRKKVTRYKQEMVLIDSEKFRQNKTYRFMLFQL